MKYRTRIYYTEQQKTMMWDRWQKTVTCGYSPKHLNCRLLRRDINSSWFGCTKQLPDYQMVRMNESPEIETHIINSGDAMGGAGEPGTPVIAPALANAI